jgi:hypothetical protein
MAAYEREIGVIRAEASTAQATYPTHEGHTSKTGQRMEITAEEFEAKARAYAEYVRQAEAEVAAEQAGSRQTEADRQGQGQEQGRQETSKDNKT